MQDEAKQGAVRYGCHSKPRPVEGRRTHLAQDGYDFYDGLTRPARYVEVRHTMSTDCRYDKSATDRQCAGCPHAAQASG